MNTASPIITEQNHYNDLKNMMDCEIVQPIPRKGIVHVGAHVGEEVEQYFSYGFNKIILIEANPHWYDILVSKFGNDDRIKIFNYAVCDKEGTVDFHIHTSRSGSTEPASMFQLKLFKEILPTFHTPQTIKVPALTLNALFERNNLDPADYNFMNLDIQGAELMAFKGATKLLPAIDVIICEVILLELYEGGPLEDDITNHLQQIGFAKQHAVYHTLYDRNSTFRAFGDCLFVKEARAS